ncbi:hypothetical protein D1AOALGA4SA_5563 [Olavius algarvensis Delta 1 endosymbiont]|nr:hypothetical protein D1AOALGA4SA_5563 [Olavius algarvensis Delta 1 endosymbiont]
MSLVISGLSGLGIQPEQLDLVTKNITTNYSKSIDRIDDRGHHD